MNEKVRFVFSTRTLGGNNAFCARNCLPKVSAVRAYLTEHFADKECLYDWLKAYYDSILKNKNREDEKARFDDNFECSVNDFFIDDGKASFDSWYDDLNDDKKNILFDALLNSRTVSAKIEHETSCCPGEEAYDRLTARFSYYCLCNPGTAEGIEAFAVPHLEWKADKVWIQALIEEKFDKKANDFDTLYLILHDNDVPGHEKTVFHFLTPRESKLLLGESEVNQIGEDQEKEEVLLYKGKKINIIVFQHTWNDAMAILTNSNIDLVSIKSQFGVNKKIVNKIFNDINDENKKAYFSELNFDASVDLWQKGIDENCFREEELVDEKKYHVYNDNGALLTELMHVKIDASSAKNLLKFVERLRAPACENSSLKDVDKMRFPLIIKLYKSFFDDWEKVCTDDKKKKIQNHLNKQALEENLNRVFSFFNNSSIWIRLVDNAPVERETAEKEIKCFKELGLYDYPSAKEYIDYQVRIQKENHLDDKNGGHGAFVTPITYGNEVEARNLFLGIDKESNSLSGAFKMLGEPVSDNFKTHSTNLRILLVDDFIGQTKSNQPICSTNANEEGKLITCKIENCKNKQCKLYTIQKLLNGDFLNSGLQDNNEKYKKNTYWNNNVKCGYFEPIKLKECLAEGKLKEKSSFVLLPANDSTQIIGVKDIESALVLLNYYKFDMLFFDFLLGSDGKGGREYSTDFFRFMQCHFEKGKDESEVNVIRKIKDELSSYKKNENDATPLDSVEIVDIFKGLQVNIKTNRGPLDRFWIMPITAFNQPFINDLLNHKVRLIDRRWNISYGADPINTPWQFLYALNHFVELQLRGCVFTSKQLLTFLQYTGEELKDHIIKKEETNKEETGNTTVDFNEFQFFMGSEYASFMRHYGNMRLIQYDAVTEKDNNKSLFSTYVWENFYIKDKYLPLLALNRKMRNFYYTAAFMPNDRNGLKRLREAFNDLRLTIDLENLIQEDGKKDFEEAINNISKALNALGVNK